MTESSIENQATEMERVIADYADAVDKDIYDFVKDVIEEREVLPLTVGFVTEEMGDEISLLTGIQSCGNRIIINADDVRHILRRHGPEGVADHSMADIEDIARLSYVLANYDSIEWDGTVSSLYKTKMGDAAPQVVVKKRIDGMYYIVKVVSDSKKKRNVITTAYLQRKA